MRFTHFFFETEKQTPQIFALLECMYDDDIDDGDYDQRDYRNSPTRPINMRQLSLVFVIVNVVIIKANNAKLLATSSFVHHHHPHVQDLKNDQP